MIKHFCDKCGKQLTDQELLFSTTMTGKELCREHVEPYNKSTSYILVVNPPQLSK